MVELLWTMVVSCHDVPSVTIHSTFKVTDSLTGCCRRGCGEDCGGEHPATPRVWRQSATGTQWSRLVARHS